MVSCQQGSEGVAIPVEGILGASHRILVNDEAYDQFVERDRVTGFPASLRSGRHALTTHDFGEGCLAILTLGRESKMRF